MMIYSSYTHFILLLSYTYTHILIRLDIDPDNNEIQFERPSGADSERRQYAKTINHSTQQQLQNFKRREKLSNDYEDAVHIRNAIIAIQQVAADTMDEVIS